MQEQSLTSNTQDSSGTVVSSLLLSEINKIITTSGASRMAINLDPISGKIQDLYIGNDPEKAAKVHELSWEERFERYTKISWLKIEQFNYIANNLIKSFLDYFRK